MVISAYGDNHQAVETHTKTVDTVFDSYNQGSFLGITRGQADIRSISFKGVGVGVVMDNFTHTTSVPEPERYALMLAGLAALGPLARRQA